MQLTQFWKVTMMMAILLISFLTTTPITVSANEGKIKLLAVAEGEQGMEGSAAELYLEIRPGEGRVFIESFPAAKLDTQISTRFANKIACKFAKENCGRYDFFYTIKAKSSIIGGPSAGAAAAILTVAVLKGLPVSEDIAITGTINSGEIIGPVGHVPAKIDAATMSGIHTVLIPFTHEPEEDNVSTNLTAYAQEREIILKEVNTLEEAVYLTTGKKFRTPTKNVTIDPEYAKTMHQVAEMLCNRSLRMQEEMEQGVIPGRVMEKKVQADNLTLRGIALLEEQRAYSAASHCFGANLYYTDITLEIKDQSVEHLSALIFNTESHLSELSIETEMQTISTISDLETYMVVKDRITEAAEALNESHVALIEGNKSVAIEKLAYGIERVNSAISWMTFFDIHGKKLPLSEEQLKQACAAKISEAQEHFDYLELFFDGILPHTEKNLQAALKDYLEGRYAICLSKATMAKAEINSVLSTMGLAEEDLPQYIEAKLAVAERLIWESQQQGVFPILGYSYYTYAQDLKKNDPFSSSLYAEYALELSSLDLYFPQQRVGIVVNSDELKEAFLFFAGILLGCLLTKQFLRADRKKH